MKKSVLMAFALSAAGYGSNVHADESTVPPASESLGEIIVTAQKRASSLQDTPISITAVSGADLQARGITSFGDLAQSTPGVSLKNEGPGQSEVELRGMTSSGGNSPTVGFYLDDIPLTAPAGAQNGKVVIDPSLYDLGRVEVLRGPQGTLYGSGSMGGTVRLITNQPDPTGFHASVESILSGTHGGGFNHGDNLMLNVPLLRDTLALRVVVTENAESGWIDRVVAAPFPLPSSDGAQRGDVQAASATQVHRNANAQQLYGLRATLLWTPTERLTITPGFLYQASEQDGISAFDSNPGKPAHYQPFDIAEPQSDHIAIFSLSTRYQLDAVDVTSSAAYWTRRSTQVQDGSENFNNPNTGTTYASNNALPNPGYYGPGGSGAVSGREDDPSRQFSEELRVASRGTGDLAWVGGAFYSRFASAWNYNGQSENPAAYMDLGTFDRAVTPQWFNANSPTRMAQYALFGEATYALGAGLKGTLGLRYYGYDYRFVSIISGWGSALGAATPSSSGLITQSAQGVNPKFNLSYALTEDVLAYGTIAKGFRPGGGNAQYPTTGPYWSAVFAPYNYAGGKWPSTYRPDTVWSYELGEKARLWNRRVTLNTSVYYEDWRNIQLESVPGDWPVNLNGNRARIYGAELESECALGGGFVLAASGGWVHATLDAGPHWQIEPRDKLSDVAPLTANLRLNYARPLSEVYSLSARLESSYVGSRYSIAFPFGASLNGRYIELPSYALAGVRTGLHSSRGWSLSVFVNNIFDKRTQLESLWQETLPSASFNRIVTSQPRTLGVDLSLQL